MQDAGQKKLRLKNRNSNCHFIPGLPHLLWGGTAGTAIGPTVTEAEVKANADYMAKNLKEFGWEYIVVDIRWYVENDHPGGYNQKDPVYVMDEYGRFTPALNRFPSAAEGKGFKPLADYIHSLGLKFGIHVMRGSTCNCSSEKYSRTRHQCKCTGHILSGKSMPLA